MDTFNGRELIVAALRARRSTKYTESGGIGRFNCVWSEHSSEKPAWLGDQSCGCHSCGVGKAPLSKLAEPLGVVLPKQGSALTVADYAGLKHFSIEKLKAWGVHDMTSPLGAPCVGMPYRDVDGKHLRTKYRVRGKKGRNNFWLHDGRGPFLYGLWQLAKHPDASVILVEGESDCHAAWHHSVLAIGVPGANGWKTEWTHALAGRQVYVWQEPGAGGVSMVEKIAPDLPHAKVIESDGVKDLADLHRDCGKEFGDSLKARMANAYPIGDRPPAVPFDVVLGPTLDRLKIDKLKPIDAVPTPFPTWNRHCRDGGGGVGIARGWPVVVAAKTGRGKSLLGLNIAASAVRAGERVTFVSLEMSQEQLVTRFMSIISGQPIRDLERGDSFDHDTYARVSRELVELYDRTGGCLSVNRKKIRGLDDVVRSIEYENDVNGSRFFVIDYLQLCRATAKSERESELLQQMTAVSGAIVECATKLDVITVALSQFNRTTSASKSEKPTAQGLMGGSVLENDAAQVVLVDHTVHTYNAVDQSTNTALILDKNRHGGAGSFPVLLDFRTLQAREVAKAQEGHIPAPRPPLRAERRSGRDAAIPDEDRGEAWEPPPAETGGAQINFAASDRGAA